MVITIYHELTHAGHYAIMKGSWYNGFVNAELAEIARNAGNPTFSPYGDGTVSNSAIIALGESWAYHMGHFMADMRYATLASCQRTQSFGASYGNLCDLAGTGHPHLDALEFFNPNLAADPFHWIPKGLYQDLIDANNATDPVPDNVFDYYTNQRLFTAFSSSITTLQGYRTNLLNQNGNNQLTDVTSLFTSYHY